MFAKFVSRFDLRLKIRLEPWFAVDYLLIFFSLLRRFFLDIDDS